MSEATAVEAAAAALMNGRRWKRAAIAAAAVGAGTDTGLAPSRAPAVARMPRPLMQEDVANAI